MGGRGERDLFTLGDAPRSDWAAVIGNEQVRDGLLSEVSDHMLALVAVMDRLARTGRSRPLSASFREQHLDQMTVRLGRLLYDNPTWTPARRDTALLKEPAVIAPSIADMVPTARAVLHAFEGLTVVAERDRQDVGRVLRVDTGQPGRDRLLTAYEQLGSPKVRASRALSEAMLLAAPAELHDELWQDIRVLELRRGERLDGGTSDRAASLRRLRAMTTGADSYDSRLDLPAVSRVGLVPTPSPASPPPLRRQGGRFR
ncbi:hypothetical protein [Microbispora sp. GKU 823]|uniref:hypothetical protein n=1 Tax=Microbispora sp. GKU 823 TaxID=1652100 RepID=UPI0009C93D5C|nr:hypothetical protein [Microbispora sp. GKU 823]OPG01655.1 hypothetical protein B1L11_44105 [Microbispora sp. GKU 823]